MHNRPENFDKWSLELNYRCNNTYCYDYIIDRSRYERANSTISSYQFEVEPIYGVNYGVEVNLFFGVDGYTECDNSWEADSRGDMVFSFGCNRE